MDHSGHMGMDHDMSEPSMAAAMERDMRNKFFLALLLTIPTVLYSPLGMRLLGRELATFGLDMNLIMLVLSTPVVFYAGWIFIAGAYQSLRRRVLNMSVLIATGVLAAYLFSLLITVVGGETFYEAAAMLVTFVLFGHWMEMRSRRGTNDALRALFDLVPPQATVIRDDDPEQRGARRRHRVTAAGGQGAGRRRGDRGPDQHRRGARDGRERPGDQASRR
jgi:Cu2+-exporting ATPase